MQIVSTSLACVWLISLLIVGWGTIYTIWRMNFSRMTRKWGVGLPPVSILKPIKGIDPSLKENLESFIGLDYPTYEVIFAIADEHDLAVAVAKQVIAENPGAPLSLIVGDVEFGENPKVNNLILAEKRAEHETLLVSDSNIRAHKSYLQETVALIRNERTGIVTAPIQGFGASGFGGGLEELHLNTFYYRWMNLAKNFGQVFVMGKSMMYQRQVASRFGGIGSCANYINEDYLMGLLMQIVGKRIDLNNRPIHQYVGEKSFKDFWSRHYRWSVIQKQAVPMVFLGQILQFSFVVAAIGAFALPAFFTILWWQAALLTIAIWYALDAALLISCRSKPSLKLWLAREALAPLIWFHALCSNRVDWRGNKLRIVGGGRLEKIKQ